MYYLAINPLVYKTKIYNNNFFLIMLNYLIKINMYTFI